MNGKVHTFIGTVAMGALIYKYGNTYNIEGIHISTAASILTVNIGSVAADGDLMYLKLAKKGHKLASKAAGAVTGGHRGVTHYPAWAIPMLLLMDWTQVQLAQYTFLCPLVVGLEFGFLVGWALHLFADYFNGKGIPLAGPFIRKRFHFLDIPSEGIGAWIFAFVLTALVVYGLYMLGGPV